MRHIRQNEECIGKYVLKKTAARVAKEETQRTGINHIPFFTHYEPVWESDIVTCWTVIVDKSSH